MLERKQANLEKAQAVAHLGNWHYDQTNQCLKLSHEGYLILGLEPGTKVSTDQLIQLVHPEDKPLIKTLINFDHSINEFDDQFRLLITGKTKWVHLLAKLNTDSNGILKNIEGTIQDITALKQVEAQLLDQNNKYLSLLENINGISWEVDLTTSKFIYVSANVKRILGYPASEWVDINAWIKMIVPEDREFAIKFCEAETAACRDHVFEYRMKKKSGEIVWVLDMVSVIKDDLGQANRLAGFIVDISKQRQSADALKQKESYQQALLNNFPFLVWLKDTEGKFLAVNQPFAAAANIDNASELTGKTDLDIWPKDLAMEYRSDDRKVMNKLEKKEIEEEISDQGIRKWFETFKAPVLDDEKRLLGTVGFSREITERKLIEEKLKLAASVFVHANEGISITNASGIILDVNQSFSRITGYSRTEVIDKHYQILKSELHDDEFYQSMWKTLIDTGHWSGETQSQRKNGESFTKLLSINAVKDSNGQILNYVSLFNDITTQKEYQQKLEYIAHYDALTKLPNRVLLADRLSRAMETSIKNQSLLAVAYLDLDGFKEVNDIHGHAIGDQLLESLASRFNDALREEDTISRIGGDEFVAVFANLSEKQQCFPLIESLLECSAEPFYIQDLMQQVSASIGVCFYPQEQNLDPDQLLRQADQAMYQSKLSGKNRYYVFDPEQDKNVKTHHESIGNIKQALSNNEFVLFYQPKVNMNTGKVFGMEALIRWQHPKKGLLAPDSFLPVIENDALIIKIGDWVLQTALDQLNNWHQTGLKISVSVNVAPLQLQSDKFVDTIENLLDKYPKLERHALELEILESSALHDISLVSEIIHRCRKLGVSFALDDFGTGYSSLTYLKKLPASTLKVDRSFVRDILDDPEDLAILEGIIGLSSAFQRVVIAEGVETEEHGKLLLQLGCENAQGYGISRPMPADEVVAWVAEWHVFPQWVGVNRIPRTHLKLLFAGVEYRNWVKSIEDCINDPNQTTTLKEIECPLENWYFCSVKKQYGDLPNFKQIQITHLNSQAIAKKIQALLTDNKNQLIQAEIKQLIINRDLVGNLLNETLENALK